MRYVETIPSEAIEIFELIQFSNPQLRNRADARWYIPMVGMSTSFNISVSMAILMAYLRKLELVGVSGDMTPEERELTKLRWMIESVEGALPILERSGINMTEIQELRRPAFQVLRDSKK
jgi:hypothetical protein